MAGCPPRRRPTSGKAIRSPQVATPPWTPSRHSDPTGGEGVARVTGTAHPQPPSRATASQDSAQRTRPERGPTCSRSQAANTVSSTGAGGPIPGRWSHDWRSRWSHDWALGWSHATGADQLRVVPSRWRATAGVIACRSHVSFCSKCCRIACSMPEGEAVLAASKSERCLLRCRA
jgi:hypothetical protein